MQTILPCDLVVSSLAGFAETGLDWRMFGMTILMAFLP
jgi:hypothetical protein